MTDIDNLTWSNEHADDALVLLAERAGMGRQVTVDKLHWDPDVELAKRLEETARACELEAQPISVNLADLGSSLRAVAPALLSPPGHDQCLVLVKANRRTAVLLDREGNWVRRPWAILEAWLGSPIVASVEARVGGVLRALGDDLKPSKRKRVIETMATAQPFPIGWMIREVEGLADGLSWRRLIMNVAGLLSGHSLQFGLFIVAWTILGQAGLSGNPDTSWLWLWGLAFATMLTLRSVVFWHQGCLTLQLGLALRRRLLGAAFRQPADKIRTQGSGSLLGRVLESEALESAALNGGIGVLFATIEVAVGGLLLASTVGMSGLSALFAMTVAGVIYLAVRYYHAKREWTTARLDVTGDLVEQLLARETRLVQQQAEYWHRGEDIAINKYRAGSESMDRLAAGLKMVPQLWLLAALLVLFLVDYSAGWPTWLLASTLGIVILIQQSLIQLIAGSGQLGQAIVLWRLLKPLFEDSEVPHPPKAVVARASTARLCADGLQFRYPDGQEVLKATNLELTTGQHLLVTGQSGTGKSTLAGVLAGHLPEHQGSVLLDGLDQHALGTEAWRKRVLLAPQFHHNFIFPDTLAFNLLLGRSWPPSKADLNAAQEICTELGLGELLERMPGGLMQLVGEGGWPLSHGEAARVHIARCILQQPDFAILDESLGPLDPRSFSRVLESLRARLPSMILIAHP
jgi:ATP-binding cassette subfamily B protein